MDTSPRVTRDMTHQNSSPLKGVAPAWKEEIEFDNIAEDKKAPEKKSEPAACWKSLIKILQGIWSTNDMLTLDRDVEVQMILREFIIYLVFLVILTTVALSSASSSMYQYTKVINDLFERQKSVFFVDDLWDFLENDFLDGIYLEEWYNEGEGTGPINPCPKDEGRFNGPCSISKEDRMILHSSVLLGPPQIRQLRVRNDSCKVPEIMRNHIQECYGHYSKASEDKTGFEPTHITFTDTYAWNYRSAKELKAHYVWGNLGVYSGAGFAQLLGFERNVTASIFKELRENLWISEGTRYVSLDFNLYNANSNLLSVVQLIFEFPLSGGVLPTISIYTVKLLQYLNPGDYIVLSLEFVFMVFIFYYIIEEGLEIGLGGIKYFKRFWSLIDILVVLMSITVLFLDVYAYFKAKFTINEFLMDSGRFVDFFSLVKICSCLQYAISLAVFVAWIKVFKYISFNKTMMQLSGTLQKSAKDVVRFLFLFEIVFGAYAQIAYIIFGTKIEDFSSMTQTLFTQLRVLLGDFDFASISKASPILGPLWFISYIFFVFFILMNMFLAIINDTYSEVKTDIEAQNETFQAADFVMRGYNNLREIFTRRDQILDIQTTIKLANDDGIVTYEEIREGLKRLNLSDVEIEILCKRYDNDDGTFNLTGKNNKGKVTEEPNNESSAEETRAETELVPDVSSDNFVNMTSYNEVMKRVKDIDMVINTLISKMDDAIKKIMSAEGA